MNTVRKTILKCLCFAATAGLGFCSQTAAVVQEPPSFVAETDSLRLAIGADARTIEFTDKSSGINHCSPAHSFAKVRCGGGWVEATRATVANGRLELEFAGTGVSAILGVTGVGQCITVEVLACKGDELEEFVFANVALTLQGGESDSFAACALALNLRTNVRELPRATNELEASCYRRFGFVGAKVALLGCRPEEMRKVMQSVVRFAPELPQSSLGGPWALDADINRGSYLFNFSDLSEETVDDWITLTKSLGFNQIDFHGGGSFRFGDCELNPKTYPRGRASLKAVVDKLHAAGIKAGLHTYAFFIDKKCSWVTPVPDARLAKSASFTLAEALDSSAKKVSVTESTKGVSTLTGWAVRNSVTLQIDDELIVFSGVSQMPPYGFTQCERGALGTKAVPHHVGAKVYQLKECFRMFVPDPDSTLFTEVAERTAAVFNECGFDMIYLDALDGRDVLAGAENSWHYSAKFVFGLWRHLKRPALMEMSTFHHHLWYVRSRMGAWDYPNRSYKRFIDIHSAANAEGRGTYLPMHLGWWEVKNWKSSQASPTFVDDIEYLCAKAIGNDVGFSLMGVTPAVFEKNPALQRLGSVMRQYEELRHAKYFSPVIRERLRVPGDEFMLERRTDGAWQFRPATYQKHKVETHDERSATWTVENRFEAQPLRMRLEVLMSAEKYESPNAVTITEFGDSSELVDHGQADGVSLAVERSTKLARGFAWSEMFTASNARPERSGTWAYRGKTFKPAINLGSERALGVWVYGDGLGEVLNFQLKSPARLVAGIGEHYVVVDFKGWRYFELIEPEGERIEDYRWPYQTYRTTTDYKEKVHSVYSLYRDPVNFKEVEKFSIWINNLPGGGTTNCSISPVRALPLVKTKIHNPRLTVGERTLILPAEIESGSFVEFNSPRDCRVYGPDGALLQELAVTGETPILAVGFNSMRFSCDQTSELGLRLRVTTITVGAPLQP